MSHPIRVTTDSFDAEVARSDIPVVIDFWAPWCGPCRAVGPVLDELSARFAGRVKVAKVNVDEEPALADAFQVRGIPTLAAVRKGAIVDVQVGFRGRDSLDRLFDRLAQA